MGAGCSGNDYSIEVQLVTPRSSCKYTAHTHAHAHTYYVLVHMYTRPFPPTYIYLVVYIHTVLLCTIYYIVNVTRVNVRYVKMGGRGRGRKLIDLMCQLRRDISANLRGRKEWASQNLLDAKDLSRSAATIPMLLRLRVRAHKIREDLFYQNIRIY